MQIQIFRARTDKMAGACAPAVVTLAALAILLNLLPSRANGGDYDNLPWTQGEGRVTFETISPKQAREEALDLARRRAVANVTGYQVSSTADRVRIQSGNEMMDRFRQITASEVHGHIVEEEILGYRTDMIDEALQMVCTIRARVAVDARKPDPSFRLQSKLLGPESRVFRSGEQLILELQATKDCYVTVFNVATDGSYAVLIPTERLSNCRLVAKQAQQFPSKDERVISPIRVYAEPDRETTEEYFFIVATLEQYPFLSNELTELGNNLVATPKASPSDFSRWMLQIPPDQRTTSDVFYSIVP
jgi:hypothetical protein